MRGLSSSELGHSRMVPEDVNGAILHCPGAHAMNHEDHLVRPACIDGHPELVGRLRDPFPAQIHRVLGRLHDRAEGEAAAAAVVLVSVCCLGCRCRSLLRCSALVESKHGQSTIAAKQRANQATAMGVYKTCRPCQSSMTRTCLLSRYSNDRVSEGSCMNQPCIIAWTMS